MVEAGFVDIWRERHPTERAYTWFNRRARGLDAARVDYILVSSELALLCSRGRHPRSIAVE